MSEETGDRATGRLGYAVRLTGRLLAVALIGLLLGIGAYALGVWTVNEIVTPLQDHAVRLDRVEAQISERSQQAGQLDDRMADARSEVQGELSRLNGRLEVLSEDLAAVEDELSGQAAEVRSLSQLESEIGELEQLTETLEGRMEAFNQQAEVDRLTIERLGARLTYMRAMVLISRADSLIARSELTAAEQTIAAAIQELVDLAAGDEETQQEVEALIQRLELARGAIRSRPQVASEDLDAAWELLAGITDS